MKSNWSVLLTGAAVASLLLTSAAAQTENQSLGEYARVVRKNKPAPSASVPKVYDNDNMPVTATLSIVGNSDAQADDAQAACTAKADDRSAAADPAKDSTSPSSAAEKSEKEPEIRPEQSTGER